MKPQIQKIDRSNSVWQISTTTYSSNTASYSGSSVKYGGGDFFSDLSTQAIYIESRKPTMFQPIDNKPKIDRVSVL